MKKIVVLILTLAAFSTCLCFAKKRDTGVAIPPSTTKYQNDDDSSEKESRAEKREKRRAEREAEREREDEELEREYEERKAARKEKKNAKKQKKNEDNQQSPQDNRTTEELEQNDYEVPAAPDEQNSSVKTVIQRNGKNTDIVQGIGRMEIYAHNASIGFYVASPKKAWYPVIETSDFAESTYISLFIDGVEHRLNRSKKTAYFFEVDNDSVTVVYQIEKIAELRATYKFEELKKQGIGIEPASILVSYSLMNIDRMAHSYMLKVVYNTVLGESSKAHFSIPTNEDVNSEIVLVPSQQDWLVVSSDGKRKMKFFIFENGMVHAKNVVLANKDVIENSSLVTDFRKGRSFNSVLSYNNSCVALFWDENALLNSGDKTFYRIELSNSEFGNTMMQDVYHAPVPPPEEEVPLEEPQLEPEVQATEPQPMPQPEPQLQQTEAPKENLNYDFKTERNYLDPSIDERYVRKLIDQINALERSDPDVNRAKIRELQAEIDEVLRVLRSRR